MPENSPDRIDSGRGFRLPREVLVMARTLTAIDAQLARHADLLRDTGDRETRLVLWSRVDLLLDERRRVSPLRPSLVLARDRA